MAFCYNKNMDKIKEYLFSKQDLKYRAFTLPLLPNIDEKTFIGVRLPDIKKYAKELDNESKNGFLKSLPHQYHEENILHAFILSSIKDYDEYINKVNEFLPFVTNWSTSDTLCNKYLLKHKEQLVKEVYKWLKSDEIYRVRYAIKCLMNYYLGEDFKQEHLERVREVKLEDYYVKMMIAWYLATGLAKNYEQFVKAIEEKWFDNFTHNKAIQKAVESYRVCDEHKTYLKTLKVQSK